jgi:predicted transport protein
MGELKLFRFNGEVAEPVPGGAVALEKTLQTSIEKNMETLFGVRFLASEHSTGAKHRGRIDSLGMDENSRPVIFEYKRSMNENVINQGLFYLDWLMDHKGDFQVLVQGRLGPAEADKIDWSGPRLVCVASDFTRYDEHAIAQMGRSIDLVRYRDFTGGLLALDLIATTDFTMPVVPEGGDGGKPAKQANYPTVTEALARSSDALKSLYADLDALLLAMGDDVSKATTKVYFAYRRLKNFACVEVRSQSNSLLVFLRVDPDSVALEEGFTRDVRTIGHLGTGDLEVRISSSEDLDRATPLIQKSYDAR